MLSPDRVPLPLPRWGAEAYEGEPAHGYFVRLAARNSAHSVVVFAASLGLNGRDFDLSELLEFCQRFPASHRERMVAATPVVEGARLRLNGQVFRRTADWSLAQPRVCGACLGESRHYRNWWDLTVLARCPIHEQPLIAGTRSSRLAWWYPNVGVTPDGHDLALSGVQSVRNSYASWDAYVLGRIGVLPRLFVPVLDDCEMFEAIGVSEAIGKIVLFAGDDKNSRRIPKSVEQRHQLLCAGFNVVRTGPGGLVDLLETHLRRKGSLLAEAQSQSPRALYGWVIGAMRNMPKCPAKEVMLEALCVHAQKYGVDSREGVRSGKSVRGGHIALVPLARELDISRQRLRMIAEKCGMMRDHLDKGKYHSFSAKDVATIRATLEDLVSRDDAMKLLGVGSRMFRTLVKNGVLSPFLNGGRANMMFRKSQLEQLTPHDLRRRRRSNGRIANTTIDLGEESALARATYRNHDEKEQYGRFQTQFPFNETM